jgi:hypothetical protein
VTYKSLLGFPSGLNSTPAFIPSHDLAPNDLSAA